ncbi:MAG: ATP-binding protein [Fervidobacterium gondwanense]|uniref:Putative ATP-dependent DNA helicase recG C-terminal n=1 Tax=Fervidobacterium gondwanense DSM 13020 TaxID=1121883 RepID=A0A1M7RS86_FERGO|nr:ATP-binding protein [Fervidobacterium gondwanense]SHN49153.1 Putative ATP-dependent DNA helicase recG C-terminal [Fervidobacterium gondwanense DSM 13020]
MTAEKLNLGKEALDEPSFDLLLKTTKENQPELRNLSNDELLRILGVLTTQGNITLAGLLACGMEDILHEFVPFHEVILNYFDGAELKEQKVYHTNLISVFTELINIYKVYNRGIGEVIKDGIRYEIPLIDNEAYREAISNALIHRDFSIAGSVSINWYEDGRLVISNPGGFVEGVTVDNILSVTPYPRNPLLSELFRRTGIVEKTGRGVDKISVGQAKYGKPPAHMGCRQQTRLAHSHRNPVEQTSSRKTRWRNPHSRRNAYHVPSLHKQRNSHARRTRKNHPTKKRRGIILRLAFGGTWVC